MLTVRLNETTEADCPICHHGKILISNGEDEPFVSSTCLCSVQFSIAVISDGSIRIRFES